MKNQFVRCDQWGNYIAPVSRDEEYDLALDKQIIDNSVFRIISPATGKSRYYRRKFRQPRIYLKS